MLRKVHAGSRGNLLLYKSEALYAVMTAAAGDTLTTQDALGRFSTRSQDREFGNGDIWCRKYTLLGMQYGYDVCRDGRLRERRSWPRWRQTVPPRTRRPKRAKRKPTAKYRRQNNAVQAEPPFPLESGKGGFCQARFTGGVGETTDGMPYGRSNGRSWRQKKGAGTTGLCQLFQKGLKPRRLTSAVSLLCGGKYPCTGTAVVAGSVPSIATAEQKPCHIGTLTPPEKAKYNESRQALPVWNHGGKERTARL